MGHVEVTEVVTHDTIVGIIMTIVVILIVIDIVHDMIDEALHIVDDIMVTVL
jgi:hypothetical protein